MKQAQRKQRELREKWRRKSVTLMSRAYARNIFHQEQQAENKANREFLQRAIDDPASALRELSAGAADLTIKEFISTTIEKWCMEPSSKLTFEPEFKEATGVDSHAEYREE